MGSDGSEGADGPASWEASAPGWALPPGAKRAPRRDAITGAPIIAPVGATPAAQADATGKVSSRALARDERERDAFAACAVAIEHGLVYLSRAAGSADLMRETLEIYGRATDAAPGARRWARRDVLDDLARLRQTLAVTRAAFDALDHLLNASLSSGTTARQAELLTEARRRARLILAERHAQHPDHATREAVSAHAAPRGAVKVIRGGQAGGNAQRRTSGKRDKQE